jgi:hypothetical protein
VGEDACAQYEALTGNPAPTNDEVRAMYGETHALIYTDGCVALTLYETCYAIWSVRSGRRLGGGSGNYRLSEAACKKIAAAQELAHMRAIPIRTISLAQRLRIIVDEDIEHEGVALTCEVVEQFNEIEISNPISVEEANRQIEEWGEYEFRDGVEPDGAWVRRS